MNTERPPSIRLPLLAAGIAIVLACSSDTQVGCSPTLTCSLRQARFAPPPGFDAGPQTCDLSLRRCAATALSAGGRHSCAVTDAKSLLCWGDDSDAQRGDTIDDLTSAHATDLSEGIDGDASVYLATVSHVLDGAEQVAAGGAHTCALLQGGSVVCWGRNADGQVSDRSDAKIIEAALGTGISNATQIAAGAAHSCAVVADGVMCWGSGRYGQVGRMQSVGKLAPALVPGTAGAVEVACGVRHTCARLDTHEVLCWGELIDAAGAPYVTPLATAVPQLSALGISAGAGHSCALTTDYAVVCWGSNASGQLGDGSFTARATPATVTGFDDGAGQVAAGGGEFDGQLVGHSCAIDKSAQVACWGRDAEGQLGVGLGSDSATRQVVLLARVFDNTDQRTLGEVVRLALGAFHSCALASQGAVYCWGDNTFQQLGADFGLGKGDMPPIDDRALRVIRFGSMR